MMLSFVSLQLGNNLYFLFKLKCSGRCLKLMLQCILRKELVIFQVGNLYFYCFWPFTLSYFCLTWLTWILCLVSPLTCMILKQSHVSCWEMTVGSNWQVSVLGIVSILGLKWLLLAFTATGWMELIIWGSPTGRG